MPLAAFIGQVPPCTTVQVVEPFSADENDDAEVEGDLIFADPSGNVWQCNLAEALVPADSTEKFLESSIGEAPPLPWKSQVGAPVCS